MHIFAKREINGFLEKTFPMYSMNWKWHEKTILEVYDHEIENIMNECEKSFKWNIVKIIGKMKGQYKDFKKINE